MPRTDPARYTDPVRATRTRGETARLVGCSPNKVGELIEHGLLQAVSVGNRDNPTVASIEKLLGRPIQELEAPLRAIGAVAPAAHRHNKKERSRRTEAVA